MKPQRRRGVPTIAALLATYLVVVPLTNAKSPVTAALDLEPSLESAALVLAARVESVQEVPIVYGGKGVQTLYQYSFTPLRVLKGVFSRPQLLLTSADLQRFGGHFDPNDIQTGEHRLLLLGRSSVGFANVHFAQSAELAFPRIADDGDPLLAAVDAVLGLREVSDRFALTDGLAHHLKSAEDRGAVVLLAALERRSYVAAQHIPAIEVVASQLESGSAIVREAAADALADLLEADYLENPTSAALAVDALVRSLERPQSPLAPRVAALQALSSTVDAVRANEDAIRLIEFDAPYESFAELSSRLEVLGRLRDTAGSGEALARFASTLALDAPFDLQRATAMSWARIAESGATDLLLERLHRKQVLGLDGVAEIEALGLVFEVSDDAWLRQREVLELDLTTPERIAFVKACELSPSPQLVPALSRMLEPRQPRLRRLAIELLMKMDSRTAALALREQLAAEIELAYKLRMAAFLGRHGFEDGYTFAIEHMSEPRYLEAAIEALADIRKPGTIKQLREIYRNSNDPAWQRAAIRALGLVGDREFGGELVKLTENLAGPLAPAALVARADLGDESIIQLLPAALKSRNEVLAIAAAKAANRALPHLETPGAGAKVRDALSGLALDSQANHVVRLQALEVLVSAEDPNLDGVLVAMIRDSRIGQGTLLDRVRELLKERKVRIT